MAVRVTLAGHVGIEVDGVDVAEDVLGRPGRLALAYLAWERQRPVPRDELAEVLWGEGLPRSWEQLLRGNLCSSSVPASAPPGWRPKPRPGQPHDRLGRDPIHTHM